MKLFQREQRSLFGEILDWMLTPLLLLWPVTLLLTWLVAQGIANKPFDRALEYNVQALAQLVSVQQGVARVNLNGPARDLLRADDSDLVYYQVLGTRGELVSGEKDLPLPVEDEKLDIGTTKLRDDQMRGQDVRVAYLYVRSDAVAAVSSNASANASAAAAGNKTGNKAGNKIEAKNEPQAVLVQVAETREKRSTLATEIVKGVMWPQFALMPLAVLLVWFALIRGIKPLSQLEDRIRQRKPDDLSPLDQHAVPTEVQPLVLSVNDLLARLKQSIATQKRFLADAAHQLKTPLAGLRMQADLALRSGTSEADLKQSLKQVSRSSVRATHTVNQLLALARAEVSGQSMQKQRCNLAQLTVEVVQDCHPAAMDKRLDLGYEGVEPHSKSERDSAMVMGNPTLLKEMVRNLVENAINYTPSTNERPGVITARVLADSFSPTLILQIEDNGPGIAESERELVLQPFYRTLGNEADGSGLGLAIVAEVALQHGATLGMAACDPKAAMPGVRITVRIPKLLLN